MRVRRRLYSFGLGSTHEQLTSQQIYLVKSGVILISKAVVVAVVFICFHQLF